MCIMVLQITTKGVMESELKLTKVYDLLLKGYRRYYDYLNVKCSLRLHKLS